MNFLLKIKKNKFQKGFSLVESIIMIFIATVCIVAVWRVYTFYIKISLSNPHLFQAAFLSEEGIEVVKFMRDSSWDSNIAVLSNNVEYSIYTNGNNWYTTTTLIFIDSKFDRRIVFSPVYRDLNGNISPSGTLDPNIKKVLSKVSWFKDGATTTKQINTYVGDIFNN